jgi:L-fuconolactonase
VLIVDTHVHVVAPEGDAEYPRAEIAARTEWVVGYALDGETLQSRLTGAGVEKAVLVQALSAHAFDNSYTADCARRFPNRFTSVGALDLAAENAVATLNHWAKDSGIRGVRLRPSSDQPLDDTQTLSVWQVCTELNLPSWWWG